MAFDFPDNSQSKQFHEMTLVEKAFHELILYWLKLIYS